MSDDIFAEGKAIIDDCERAYEAATAFCKQHQIQVLAHPKIAIQEFLGREALRERLKEKKP